VAQVQLPLTQMDPVEAVVSRYGGPRIVRVAAERTGTAH
jgi:hypothetical protein